MPVKSKKQNAIMHATLEGANTGIPKKVAKEFVKATHGIKVSKLPNKVKKKK